MTISSQIIEVLDELCKRFGLVIDWSAENVLPYLTELAGKYISYEIAMSWAWMTIGVIALIFGVWMFYKDILHPKAWHSGVVSVAGVVMVFIALCIVIEQAFDIITCKCLPEKMIFEYVSFLMKSA